MQAVSLFSGAGGFEIGFERAGIRTVLQAEQDPWCLEVLARHWPDVERVTDVRSVGVGRMGTDGQSQQYVGPTTKGQQWRTRSRCVDLIYGGFPCQDVSVAGNQAGLGGARSGLWSEFARVLCELRPTWLCVENVPGLLSSAGGRDFGTILSDLDQLGYGVAWAVLDARFFGVAQRRRRVFIVGCLGNPDAAAAVLAVCESCGGHPQTRRETGEGAPAGADGGVAFTLPASSRGTGDGHGNAWNSNYIAGSEVSPGAMRPLTARSTGYRMDGESENFVVADLGVTAFDWQASAGNDDSWRGKGRQHVVRSGDYAGANSGTRVDAIAGSFGVRRLTPTECERLMGWPDGWTKWTADEREIPDSHRYRLCGNGVVSTVAEWIGWRLMTVDRMIEESA